MGRIIYARIDGYNNWRFETMEYFLQLIMIHLLIIALLFMPFFICVTMLIKSKKKIYILFSLISFIFPLVLYNRDVFWGYKITNECYVKKHFFRKTYYLSNNRGELLVDYVFEWVITNSYIYGFDGYESEASIGFIYDRNSKTGKNLNHNEFICECRKLGLELPTCFDNIFTLRDGLPVHTH